MITRTARVILGLLGQSPQSAWDLKQSLRRQLLHLWSESDGQLYPAIKELLAAKLITAAPSGRRGRTPLRITDDGRRVLKDWVQHEPEPDTPRDELALRIALIKDEVDPAIFRHLDDELQRCLQVTATERGHLGAPDRHMLLVTSIAANWLARRWVILQHEARAAWCREAITHLREIAHPDLNPLLQERPKEAPQPQLDLDTILRMITRGETPPEGWERAFE